MFTPLRATSENSYPTTPRLASHPMPTFTTTNATQSIYTVILLFLPSNQYIFSRIVVSISACHRLHDGNFAGDLGSIPSWRAFSIDLLSFFAFYFCCGGWMDGWIGFLLASFIGLIIMLELLGLYCDAGRLCCFCAQELWCWWL